jgi:acyl carrier protein
MFDDSFGQLDLDSLARTEIATRVAARWGVDIEDQLTPDTTPAEVRRLALRAVNER